MKPEQLRAALHGVLAILVTPFTSELEVDVEGLAGNVNALLQEGIHGLLVSGTYGEFPTLRSSVCGGRMVLFAPIAAL